MGKAIVGLDEVSETSSEFGNKVKNLAILAHKGVRVPRTFVLPYDAYNNHIASLLPVLKQVREQSIDFDKMAEKFKKIILSKPLSSADTVLDTLKNNMTDVSYFAVRSSGVAASNNCEFAEDSSTSSLAGQYESFLLVPVNNVPQAILSCYASLFSERCLRQFHIKENESYLNSRMSVLIQEMYCADLSAVVMTRDPIENRESFGIEITYGACEALVSGKVQGDGYLLDRATGEIIDRQLGAKATYIEYKPLVDLKSDNKIIKPITDELRFRYAASNDLIAKIHRIGMCVEQYFNAPQDIELVVTGGEIIIVQTRPIIFGT